MNTQLSIGSTECHILPRSNTRSEVFFERSVSNPKIG